MSLADDSVALQLMNQLMDGSQGISVRCCCRCTVLVAIGSCSSPCSNPTRRGCSERPEGVDNCLIFSVLTATTPKSHWYPFRSLKYPLLRQPIPGIQGASGPVTTGHFSHLSPAQFPPASKTDDSWHRLVNPEIQMGSEPLYPNGTSVHYAPVSTKALYASVGLLCQAIKSNTSSHPFPPPGRREGPSTLFPG